MAVGEKFENLVNIMARLRAGNGCPWDIEQTHLSLRQYLLEEAYEVLECLDEENMHELAKELGDLLLQVVFHAQIARENGDFDIETVLTAITTKLIDRHPHVFGTATIKTAKDQEKNWERLKKQEGKKSAIDGVPKALSSLLRAHRMQQKAAAVGFDWQEVAGVWAKIEEEIAELKEAVHGGRSEKIAEEYGDLLFALVNLGRFIEVNPEDALRGTIEKFSDRFRQVEAYFANRNRPLNEVSLAEMGAVWELTKDKESDR